MNFTKSILFVILLTSLLGCRSKKEVETKKVIETKIEYREKEVFRDTGRIEIVERVENTVFYDTITKRVYIYPKFVETKKKEYKAITATKDKSGLIIQNIKESLTETIKQRNDAQTRASKLYKWIFWLVILLLGSIGLNIWKFKSKIPFL